MTKRTVHTVTAQIEVRMVWVDPDDYVDEHGTRINSPDHEEMKRFLLDRLHCQLKSCPDTFDLLNIDVATETED